MNRLQIRLFGPDFGSFSARSYGFKEAKFRTDTSKLSLRPG